MQDGRLFERHIRRSRRRLSDVRTRERHVRYVLCTVWTSGVRIDPLISYLHYSAVAIRLKPLQAEAEDFPSPSRRTRSLTKAFKLLDADACVWERPDEATLVQKGTKGTPGRHSFSFDTVFDEQTPTCEVYDRLARDAIQAVLAGKHATIFAYGQTGSGKTFTIQGDQEVGSFGIIQLAAKDLFDKILGKTESDKVDVKAQYFEIYNEQVRDLLVEEFAESSRQNISQHSNSPGIIKVRDDADGNPVVVATDVQVNNLDDVIRVLSQGNKNRITAATQKNKNSSRSHAIFRLTVEVRERSNIDTMRYRSAVLNLVDLAGSENGHHSGGTKIRLREGGKINQRYVRKESSETPSNACRMPTDTQKVSFPCLV